jgi:hypothetical protein
MLQFKIGDKILQGASYRFLTSYRVKEILFLRYSKLKNTRGVFNGQPLFTEI